MVSLTRAVQRQFSDKRIVCLLFYGSSAFNKSNITKQSDYDFCLVLKNRQPTDLSDLRIITLAYSASDLTLHYLDELEERGWADFQHGNHGVFFMLHLAAARTLLGTNIFARQLSRLDPEEVNASLKRQIIEYFWRIEHWLLTVSDSSELRTQLRKYLVRIAQDMLALCRDISYEEINKVSRQSFAKQYVADKMYFSDRTKQLFSELFIGDSLESMIDLHQSLLKDFGFLSLALPSK